jgi:hypothetical protein
VVAALRCKPRPAPTGARHLRQAVHEEFIIGGAALAAGGADYAYLKVQRNEAEKELVNQGITPTIQAKKELQTKDEFIPLLTCEPT